MARQIPVIEYQLALEVKAHLEIPENFNQLVRAINLTLNPDDFMIEMVNCIWNEKSKRWLGARLYFRPKDREKSQELWDRWFTELTLAVPTRGPGAVELNNNPVFLKLLEVSRETCKKWERRYDHEVGLQRRREREGRI